LKRKNKHVLLRKFNPSLNEKNLSSLTFIQYKKVYQFISSLLYEKKINERKKFIKIKKFMSGFQARPTVFSKLFKVQV
jgi:hypothetical protein